MMHASPRMLVVGTAPFVQTCAASIAATSTLVATLLVNRVPGAGHDLTGLAAYPPGEWTAFAASGPDLLNLLRLGLMAELRHAGYSLGSTVSPRASVPPSWRPGENAHVSDGAIIGPGFAARHNVVVSAGAILGPDVSLGHSVWIGAGAIIGAGATIGHGTTIAAGAVVGPRVRIGRQCDLGVARDYRDDVGDRTFTGGRFEDAVRIYACRPT